MHPETWKCATTTKEKEGVKMRVQSKRFTLILVRGAGEAPNTRRGREKIYENEMAKPIYLMAFLIPLARNRCSCSIHLHTHTTRIWFGRMIFSGVLWLFVVLLHFIYPSIDTNNKHIQNSNEKWMFVSGMINREPLNKKKMVYVSAAVRRQSGIVVKTSKIHHFKCSSKR